MSRAPSRCGIIGFPLSHTRSPQLHRAFAEQCDIDLDYVVLAAPEREFEPAAREFFARGGLGLNVTLPYKARALEFVNSASERAVRAGAANVLSRQLDGSVQADNVDGAGFIADLARRSFDARAARVYIIGAGGAAAGVAAALLEAGASSVVVRNRNPSRAKALIERLADPRITESRSEGDTYDLVINATSASLFNECPDFPSSVIGSTTLAYDLAYSTQPTPFMRCAAGLGAQTCDGWGMLVEQAAASFALWHGVSPDTSPLLSRFPTRG